jgi:DNA repair protein RecN (Recombination protein N)
MLNTLCIKDFAIVKHLELDFSQGMTAFTGETGAGKSIMIDALMLALGGRADASVIRPGEAHCDITAHFTFDKNSGPAHWLAEHDIPYEDASVYLRRIIYAEGKSKSSINGHPFPLHKIKELSELLVHIHGQHQHQTLLHHQTHRQQLDQYAKHQHLITDVTHLFRQHQELKQKIEDLEHREQQADKIQLLQFQIDELKTLNVHEGEVDALHQEHQMLHHAKDYLEHSQHIDSLLNGDEGPNICSLLNQAIQATSALPQGHPQIQNAVESLNAALIQCEEAAGEINQFAERITLDPERLSSLEERMSQIHRLARKYHIDVKQLTIHTNDLEKELHQLLELKEQQSLLKQALHDIEQQYCEAAQRLHQSRCLYAPKLAEEITQCIKKLGMPQGWFEIEISALDKMHTHGQDKVEYKVCTNPGMSLDNLSKIASGGELSRISLAIQMITAQRETTPTLLFDEVDVGIGGGTAALVGKLLRQLGSRLQVFCVTHQPQVAASAHYHFMVQKQSTENRTFTHIVSLDLHQRVDELARMIGGLTITEPSRSHAKELLEQAGEHHKDTFLI